MSKRKLWAIIEQLELRVAALEARPYYYFPPTHPIPQQPYVPWGVPQITYGNGTGGPMPKPGNNYCDS